MQRGSLLYEMALAPLGITLLMEPVAQAAGFGRDGKPFFYGAPGVREIYHPSYYGAYVLDPNGNNIEAACHKPA
jgi:hypothetical protein